VLNDLYDLELSIKGFKLKLMGEGMIGWYHKNIMYHHFLRMYDFTSDDL
jgi:hypothetical protein